MFINKNLDTYTHIGIYKGLTINQDQNGNIAIGGSDKVEFFKANSVVRELIGLIVDEPAFISAKHFFKKRIK